MKAKILDTVMLIDDIVANKKLLPKGSEGVIMEIYHDADRGYGFDTEFYFPIDDEYELIVLTEDQFIVKHRHKS